MTTKRTKKTAIKFKNVNKNKNHIEINITNNTKRTKRSYKKSNKNNQNEGKNSHQPNIISINNVNPTPAPIYYNHSSPFYVPPEKTLSNLNVPESIKSNEIVRVVEEPGKIFNRPKIYKIDESELMTPIKNPLQNNDEKTLDNILKSPYENKGSNFYKELQEKLNKMNEKTNENNEMKKHDYDIFETPKENNLNNIINDDVKESLNDIINRIENKPKQEEIPIAEEIIKEEEIPINMLEYAKKTLNENEKNIIRKELDLLINEEKNNKNVKINDMRGINRYDLYILYKARNGKENYNKDFFTPNSKNSRPTLKTMRDYIKEYQNKKEY